MNTKPMRGVPVDDSWRIEAQLHGEFSGFGPRNDERDDLDGLWSSKHYPSTNLLAGKRLGSEKYTSHSVWSQLFTSNLSQQREKVRNRLIEAWRRGVLTCDPWRRKAVLDYMFARIKFLGTLVACWFHASHRKAWAQLLPLFSAAQNPGERCDQSRRTYPLHTCNFCAKKNPPIRRCPRVTI